MRDWQYVLQWGLEGTLQSHGECLKGNEVDVV